MIRSLLFALLLSGLLVSSFPTVSFAQAPCTINSQCASDEVCQERTCSILICATGAPVNHVCVANSNTAGGQGAGVNTSGGQGAGANTAGGQGAGDNTPGGQGAGEDGASVTLQNPLKDIDSLPELLTAILRGVVRIGAIFLIVMLVWVGFLFVMARGNPEEISKARSALMWTVIGGLILLGAEAISQVIQSTVGSITS